MSDGVVSMKLRSMSETSHSKEKLWTAPLAEVKMEFFAFFIFELCHLKGLSGTCGNLNNVAKYRLTFLHGMRPLDIAD